MIITWVGFERGTHADFVKRFESVNRLSQADVGDTQIEEAIDSVEI
jgi:hypothetical protein